MKIVRVVHANIDALYKIFLSSKEQQAISMTESIPKVFEQASISFYIEDCSLLETFILSNICDGYISGSMTRNIFADYEGYEPLSKAYTSITSAMITMEKDNSVEYKPEDTLLPIGCLRKNITVTFNGEQLIGLFGVSLGSLFKDMFSDRKVEKLRGGDGEIKYPDRLPFDNQEFADKFVNYMIQMLHNEFYKAFNKYIISVDQAYENYMEDSYYKYLNNKKGIDIALAHYKSPYGFISFLGSSGGMNQVANVKKVIEDTNGFVETGTITFAVRSSILTFLEIASSTNFEIQHETFDHALNNNSISVNVALRPYKSRVIDKMVTINSFKMAINDRVNQMFLRLKQAKAQGNTEEVKKITEEMNENNDSQYFLYEFISASEKINYTITIPIYQDFTPMIEMYSNRRTVLANEEYNIWSDINNRRLQVLQLITPTKPTKDEEDG